MNETCPCINRNVRPNNNQLQTYYQCVTYLLRIPKRTVKYDKGHLMPLRKNSKNNFLIFDWNFERSFEKYLIQVFQRKNFSFDKFRSSYLVYA